MKPGSDQLSKTVSKAHPVFYCSFLVVIKKYTILYALPQNNVGIVFKSEIVMNHELLR